MAWVTYKKANGMFLHVINYTVVLTELSRFANMDFIIFSAIYMSLVLLLTFSYDICCQWSRNVRKQIPQLPRALQPPPDILRNAKLVIPKFHLHNHGLKCQLNFNLNFLRGSAQSDLEDPERYWAHQNPVSMSTREMSEGARHDTLSDHAGSWNWRKITNFGIYSHSHSDLSVLKKSDFTGVSLLDQIRTSTRMQVAHRTAFENFDATFSPSVTDEFRAMVVAWDADKDQPNPYEEPVPCKSFICLIL